MALLTTGLTSGLVIDIGNLETTVLPVKLLFQYGRYIPPTNLHLTLAPRNNIPDNILSQELLEEIKTRILFCSPHPIDNILQHDTLKSLFDSYRENSNATDLYYPISLKDGTKATLLIPGWIRERTTEVLFEGDDDEPSIVQCILQSLLKVQVDLRKPLLSSMLLIGGISHIPGLRLRLKRELLRVMRNPTNYEKKRYASLLQLSESVGFIDDSNEKGAGQIFMGNIRGWIGGSLVGSIKISGEEITKEKFTGNVADWSIGNWNEMYKDNTRQE
ncbi:hypothetical protein BDF20DRAFT_828063 [Mycotypha africana]|uniref:uncharacterized protein n=1 Tax=Mycotypha africana TaxID=64632 RepID=UPI00230164AB|nr:uncharacterized protein BDF20DRAFT_828063 [Mycotypha africana]KAI8968501.1 hypothetical protein BDF20DRAFT_828063 [Mycotypha africana]